MKMQHRLYSCFYSLNAPSHPRPSAPLQKRMSVTAGWFRILSIAILVILLLSLCLAFRGLCRIRTQLILLHSQHLQLIFSDYNFIFDLTLPVLAFHISCWYLLPSLFRVLSKNGHSFVSMPFSVEFLQLRILAFTLLSTTSREVWIDRHCPQQGVNSWSYSYCCFNLHKFASGYPARRNTPGFPPPFNPPTI